MIKKITITVLHQHLDWNNPAPAGGTTPMTYDLSIEIQGGDGAEEPASQDEALKVLVTAMVNVLDASPLWLKKG